MTLHDTMLAGQPCARPMPLSGRHLAVRLLAATAAPLVALWRHLARESALQQARAHLGELSDAQLKDIGLGRSEIAFATRFGRPRPR